MNFWSLKMERSDVIEDKFNEAILDEKSVNEDESNEHILDNPSIIKLNENFDELEEIRKELDEYDDSNEIEAINVSEIQRKIAAYVSEIQQRDERIKLYEDKHVQVREQNQLEIVERESFFAAERGVLLSHIDLLKDNCSQREKVIETLTSSINFERDAVTDLQSKLCILEKTIPQCDEIVQTESTMVHYSDTEKITREKFLKEKLTSWVSESEELGGTILTCMKEGSELVKIDNFIAPMTYSFETGNEHLTDQIALVFDCFENVLAKYNTLTNIMTNSVKDAKKTCDDSHNEDSGYEADLIKLLTTEWEISSRLSGSIEGLKHLVELSISKIIMQKPAPMLKERQIFNVVCFLTVQLLQYFSLSQKKDHSRRPSTDITGECSSFDFSSLKFIPEKSLRCNLEFSFDGCFQDASMTSLSVDPNPPKSGLESVVFPQLATALRGNMDSVDADLLEHEVKKFETSLEAAIGLVEAQLLSKDEESSLQLHTLREPEVSEDEVIASLRQKLQSEEEENEELRQKLHHVQGLLNGAREECSTVDEERDRLAEHVCKLSREVESFQAVREAKVEIHTIHTNEGQDIQKVIRDSKDKVKTLLDSKKRKNLRTEELIIMNDELEGILKNVLSESERSIDQLLCENVDLSSQLQAAERKICANKRFIDEQIIERDKEAELLLVENENLKKAMKERDLQEELYITLTDEVDSLQKELLNKDQHLQVEIVSKDELNVKLGTYQKKIEELRRTIENLESQLAGKFKDEDNLREEVAELKEKLEEIRISYKQQIEFESGFEENFSESNKCSDDEQSARKSESPNFGPSVMEELGHCRSFVLKNNLGIKRLEGLLEKVEKAVAANVNNSRASISHCSEEDVSAKDTIDTSANLERSLSPNSWECKLDEKLASFEMHIETLLKQNSDLGMQLKIAKTECEEIGAENESNSKRLDAIKETLLRDHSVAELRWQNRLQEADSENSKLAKKNSANMLKIASLQSTIDESKRVPPVDEELISRVSVLQAKLDKSDSMLHQKTDKVNELTYIVKDLKSLIAVREEEIKKLTNSRTISNDAVAAGDFSKTLESQNSNGSTYSEVQRAALIGTSVLSEITKQSDIQISKDSEILEKTLNHSIASQTAVIDSKTRLQQEQKIDAEPVNGSFSSEDSFSLNREFLTLEKERTKLQDVCKMIEEKNYILLKDIVLLTDQKLELESKLAHAHDEIQAKDEQANHLKEKSVVQINQLKEQADVRVAQLQKEKDNIEDIIAKQNTVNASLVKDLSEKEKELQMLQSEICQLEEQHKKEKRELEQQLFEKFTKNMEELADNLNKEKLSQFRELEENYKGLLSRQEENYHMNASQESHQETILNLTMQDLEKLRSNKMVRKVYREGLAILALTENERAHSSVLDFSVLSDSFPSMDLSRNTSVPRDTQRENQKSLIFVNYLEERIHKLDADKIIADAEVFDERMKYVELLEEKGMAELKFDRQLKEKEENIQFHKTEAENGRRQIEFLQEQLLLEKSNARKMRIKFDLDTKSAADSHRMQDEIIKELKATLDLERGRMLALVNEIGCHSQVDVYENTVENVFTEVAEKNNDIRAEIAIREKTEILGELEEANYKIHQLDTQYKSLKLDNNLLLSKMGLNEKKVMYLESQLINLEKAKVYAERLTRKALRKCDPRFDARSLPTQPTFRGEEIALRKNVAALQAKVDKLEREKAINNVYNAGHNSRQQQLLLEEISMEKQQTVGLFKNLFESQSDKESLRSMATLAQASGYYDKKKTEMRNVSTNTYPFSHDEELKMYLLSSQKGQDHNRIFLWKLIESQQQLKGHHEALVFQKSYLLRSLRNCADSDSYFQSRLMSLASRAVQLGDTVNRGTQTALRPRQKLRGCVFAVIAIFRMKSVKDKNHANMHKEYFRLIKAISSDEISGSDQEPLSAAARPTHLTYTPPTKDINVRSSAIVRASPRNLYSRSTVLDNHVSGAKQAGNKNIYDA